MMAILCREAKKDPKVFRPAVESRSLSTELPGPFTAPVVKKFVQLGIDGAQLFAGVADLGLEDRLRAVVLHRGPRRRRFA